MGSERAMRVLSITSVKNEAPFLLEWLAYHRAIGFTDFLVFSNDCTDGTVEMLERLQALGWLTHVPNEGPWEEGPQWAALKQADRHPLRQAADWVLFHDIDEFISVHVGDGSLAALFAALPEANAITLTWRLFGNAGQIEERDQPVTQRFTQAAPAVMGWPWRAAMFKTLFARSAPYGKLGVHRPRAPDRARMGEARWFDGSGRALSGAFLTNRVFSDYGQDNYALVQLNHYALGAAQSYVLKCARGRANREASAFDVSYWVERNFCDVEDRSALKIEPLARPLREALRADPVLGALHLEALRLRQERFAALMLEEPYRALFGRVLLAGPARVLGPEAAEMMARYGRAAQQG